MNVAISFEMPVTYANINAAPNAKFGCMKPVVKAGPSRFEVGKTYYTRSICDHDTVFKITIARRTEKSIWTTEGKQLRVAPNWEGNESVKPFGTYSMCAIISADREYVAV